MSLFGSPVDIPGAINTAEVGTSRLPIYAAYLTYGDPVTDPPSALGLVKFDVVIEEQHEINAVVTDHPVEQGTNIVDNVRPLPNRVSLEVFVSNAPVRSPDAVRAPITIALPQPGQGGFLAGGTTALAQQGLVALGIMKGFPTQETLTVDQFVGSTDYVANMYDTLTGLQNTATLISIICPNAKYDDMILEKVGLRRDASTGTSGYFTLEFRAVRIVTSNVVDAPVPSVPRGAPSVSKGQTDPSAATGPKESVAADIVDKLLGK